MENLECPPAWVLGEAGRALYGQNWKNQLARELNINPVRIRNWSSGKSPMPIGVWELLFKLLDERKIKIEKLLERRP